MHSNAVSIFQRSNQLDIKHQYWCIVCLGTRGVAVWRAFSVNTSEHVGYIQTGFNCSLRYSHIQNNYNIIYNK